MVAVPRWRGRSKKVEAAGTAAAAAGDPQHVVILQHGILGRPKDLHHVEKMLIASLPQSESAKPVSIITTSVNTGKTLDGVARGGERLAKLIRESVPPSSSISLLCHSLGGLYGRYALRQLEQEQWFDSQKVEALNLVTLATPHLGVMELTKPLQCLIGVGRCIVGQTILDLSLRSRLLCEDLVDDVALKSLSRFKRLVAYGNVHDDALVGAGTSLILSKTPVAKTHEPEVPQHCAECETDLDHDVKALPKCFKSKRPEVHYMLRRLSTLPWQRYSCRFRRDYVPWDTAHTKICMHHPQDRRQRGKNVITHLCSGFVMQEDGNDQPTCGRQEPEVIGKSFEV